MPGSDPIPPTITFTYAERSYTAPTDTVLRTGLVLLPDGVLLRVELAADYSVSAIEPVDHAVATAA